PARVAKGPAADVVGTDGTDRDGGVVVHTGFQLLQVHLDALATAMGRQRFLSNRRLELDRTVAGTFARRRRTACEQNNRGAEPRPGNAKHDAPPAVKPRPAGAFAPAGFMPFYRTFTCTCAFTAC